MQQLQDAEVIRDSPLSNGDLAPTTPERRTWGTYGVFVAFGISAVTYVALSSARRSEPATAGALAE